MDLATIHEFLGWCTALNLGAYLITTLKLTLSKDKSSKLHGKWFNIEPSSVRETYLVHLLVYKVVFITFNLVPYVALSLMTY